jgi:hypothetical protein
MPGKRLSVDDLIARGNPGHLTKAQIEQRRAEEAAEAAKGYPRPVGLDRQTRRYYDGLVERFRPFLTLEDAPKVLA